MNDKINGIFKTVHSQFNQSNQLILRNVFMYQDTEVLLKMTDTNILLTKVNSNQQQLQNISNELWSCYLEFDLKFQVLRHQSMDQDTQNLAYGLRFQHEHEHQPVELICQQATVVEVWARELEKKINQRNFHKLFKAKKKIGKGAFATVYLAQRLHDHQMVAVKAFSKEKQYSGEKGRESLENEIKIMRSISHSNLMKLQGVYETSNSIYIILEHLQGPQLNQKLKNSASFTQKQILTFIQCILKGLAHLCSKGIIHRDLKPENIMFRDKQCTDLVICDFGLATFAEEKKYLFVRCGTPGFVAPQIINIKDMSSKSSPISDVFSAGVIFHYLLFGSSIFDGKKYNEVLLQNRNCYLDFTKPQYSKISTDCLKLLQTMLQKDPSKRIQAQQALNDAYFSNTMQIEDDNSTCRRTILGEINENNLCMKNNSMKLQSNCNRITRKQWYAN